MLFASGGPNLETLLRYVYTYDAAGNRTSKKTDYDADNGSFAATATYTNNGYNQLTAVSGTPGRGTKVNVTGTIPTAWTLADGDVTVTPNSTPANAVDAEVRGRFFIARSVPLQNGDNSLVASTSATTLAGNEPTSDTVEDVALDTSISESYTYSANGDLVLKSEEGGTILWTYSYSVDGWLVKVEGPDEFVEEYAYDPIGRKISVETTDTSGTTERYFVHDGGSIVLELTEDSGDFVLDKEHVRGASLGGGIGGLLYTRAADGSLGYFHYDGQGNVVSVTDESRTEVAYYEYDAWGNILTQCGSLANEFAFSTKQASLGSGLIDFGYRWYDPQTGRWTQRDPMGTIGGANLYMYVNGNPVNILDPYGLFGVGDVWNGIASGATSTYNAVNGALDTVTGGGTAWLRDQVGGLGVDTTSRSYEVGQGIVVTAGGAFEAATGAAITLLTEGWGGAVGIPLIVDGWFTGQQGLAMIFGDPIPPNPLHDAFVGALEDLLGLSEAEAEFAYGFGKGFGTLYGLYICRPSTCTGPKTPTAPNRPPGWNPQWRYGISSRSNSATNPSQACGRSWWDQKGGEWRWHPADRWHPEGHWDYNPWTEWNSPWQNVPSGD
ncbi:MAG: RHS repeat-associated core domain-containing protein [Verrucomicrobia bacterium]|nr:RHS repeat-associated core domain-containing protein [Verrucomicrobiota bacterium]